MSIKKPWLTGVWQLANFRKLWASETISVLGSQVTVLALPLTATLLLHANAFQMGLLIGASSLPALVFSLFIGVWVDRLPRRLLIIAANIGSGLVLFTVPLAGYFHRLGMTQLYIVAFLTGIFTVIFDVASLAFIPTLVDREHLVEANGNLEVGNSTARIIGSGGAGFLIQVLTPPIAIIADAISFLIGAAFVLLIRLQQPTAKVVKPQANLIEQIREGLKVVWRNAMLRSMALSLGGFNFCASMISALYVLFVSEQLHVPASALGFIFACGSIGLPIGAWLARRISGRFGVGPTIVWAAGIVGVSYIFVPLSGGPLLVSITLLTAARFVMSLAAPVTTINQLSLRQVITPDHLRGRVNSTMRVLSQGLSPLGAVVGGLLGQLIGLRPTIIVAIVMMQLVFLVLYASPLRTIAKMEEAALAV